MAGIGFRLQKVLQGDTYLSSIKAHFFSAMITSGPWILSVINLFCLTYFSPQNISLFEMTYFKTVLIYTFAFSLIIIGMLQFPLTRFLADKLYAKEDEAVLPIFNSSMLIVVVVQTIIGCLLFGPGSPSPLIYFLSVMIYVTISSLWLVMIFLTALRDYEAIGWSYAIGTLASIFGALGLGKLFGVTGYFAGYWIGHLLITLLWSTRIFIEFRSKRIFEWQLISFIFQNKKLIFIGLFYNLGAWIDKFMFWFSSDATSITPVMKIFPVYDTAAFVAYLTIIPAMSMFIIQVETDFYKQYRRFYSAILDKATYSKLNRLKGHISRAMRDSLTFLVRYQGLISLAAITFSPEIIGYLRMPYEQITIFRVICAGAFLHSLFLVLFIIILYFDLKEVALWVAGIFCLSNGLFTYLTIQLDYSFYGYGYFVACLLSLAVSYYALDAILNKLTYLTFAKQPVTSNVAAEDSTE